MILKCAGITGAATGTIDFAMSAQIAMENPFAAGCPTCHCVEQCLQRVRPAPAQPRNNTPPSQHPTAHRCRRAGGSVPCAAESHRGAQVQEREHIKKKEKESLLRALNGMADNDDRRRHPHRLCR